MVWRSLVQRLSLFNSTCIDNPCTVTPGNTPLKTKQSPWNIRPGPPLLRKSQQQQSGTGLGPSTLLPCVNPHHQGLRWSALGAGPTESRDRYEPEGNHHGAWQPARTRRGRVPQSLGGWWVRLPPLDEGDHLLTLSCATHDFSSSVSYDLVVVP